MATFIELYDLISEDELRNKVRVATRNSAQNLLESTPTASEIDWAAEVFSNPERESQKAFESVLAVNKDATVANILGATDAAIQTNVDAVRPNLVTAFAAILVRG